MLQSKEDLYSKPECAEKLYSLAGSKIKKIVLFDHGAHSKVKINNIEKYDKVIREFLEEINIK
jgi:hypothetical protein